MVSRGKRKHGRFYIGSAKPLNLLESVLGKRTQFLVCSDDCQQATHLDLVWANAFLSTQKPELDFVCARSRLRYFLRPATARRARPEASHSQGTGAGIIIDIDRVSSKQSLGAGKTFGIGILSLVARNAFNKGG